MEEVNDLDMGFFGQGMELNTQFSFPNPDEIEDIPDEQDIEVNTPDKNIKDPVEDESSEEVDEGDEQNEGSDEGGESSSNLYSSLATVVYEQGLLPSLDIEKTPIKTIDDLVNAFKVEKETLAKTQLDEYIANLDTTQIVQSKKMIQDLSQITEEQLKEDLNLAKEIIRQDYYNQGFDETKTNRYLKRLIDLGDEAILEDALESNKSIQEFETRRIEFEKENTLKQLEQEKLNQAQLEEQLKKTVYESKDLINGFKPTKTVQDKVYKSINDIVGKSPEGHFENKFMKERRENPIEFETRMYYFYELTNGFKDYSKLTTSAKSSAVKDLEKIAQQSNKIKDNGVPIWMQDNESYGGVGYELNI